MAGISDKATKTPYTENKYRYNGKELQNKEFSDGTGLEEYDYGARQYDPQIGRMNQIDPSASKFVGISPLSYTANNPILLTDPTGKDWSISFNQNKDGSWILNINFKAQVLNSSDNKSLDTKALAGAIKKQFESVFNTSIAKDKEGPAINVVATADVTTINSKDQLAKDATLFEVRNSDDDHFKTDNPNVTIEGEAIDGKDILLNETAVNDFTDNSNTKTLPHEIGHTGGLRHPAEDPTGRPVVPYIHNPSNFMNQGTQFLGPYSNSNFTGVTREQVLRIYNLYSNGYLNQKEGTHPIDRNDLPIPF
jgi:RHS repeat-associated protein